VGTRSQLLTVDAGNSTLDCVRHDTGQRTAFDAAADSEGFAAFVREAGADRCVAVSVVEPVRERVVAVLRELGVSVRFAGREIACPLPLAYDTPDTLGADRWVGALAAHADYGCSVTVDCGTATTINLVEQDGTFRGGAIAPGLSAFVAGMAAVTPALPAADLEAESRMPPGSTADAVSTGVLLGYCGLVERLVAETVRVAGGSARIVITGGNAARLLARSRLQPTHIPDLVHRGLCLLDEGA